MPRIGSIHWKKFEKFLISERDAALPEYIILNNLKVMGISREEYLRKIADL